MATQNPQQLLLDEFLPYRLSVVTNKVSSNLASMYSQRFNLSIPEWRVMAVLGQASDISADEVCRKTEMDKVTVSRAVGKLLEKKQLVRKFSDSDRRRSMLRLSRSGFAIYAQIAPLAKNYEKELLETLSWSEKQQLDKLLTKLQTQARALAERQTD